MEFWPICLVLLAPICTAAQHRTRYGKVTDTAGGALPHAVVTVKPLQAGGLSGTRADSAGAYRVPGLSTGFPGADQEMTGCIRTR